jgi:ribosome maturation factor RimP
MFAYTSKKRRSSLCNEGLFFCSHVDETVGEHHVTSTQSDTTSTTLPLVWIGALRQPNLARAMNSVRPIVEAAGLSLIGLERLQEGRRTILWVYLDHPDGITLDQCGEVSPEISAVLDVEDPIPEAYDLRVSSPGIDRPLMCSYDFEKHIDHPVQIRLQSPLRGRRKFQGRIVATEVGEAEGEANVIVRCDDGEHHIPISLIFKARLNYNDDEIRALFRAQRLAQREAQLETPLEEGE